MMGGARIATPEKENMSQDQDGDWCEKSIFLLGDRDIFTGLFANFSQMADP